MGVVGINISCFENMGLIKNRKIILSKDITIIISKVQKKL